MHTWTDIKYYSCILDVSLTMPRTNNNENTNESSRGTSKSLQDSGRDSSTVVMKMTLNHSMHLLPPHYEFYKEDLWRGMPWHPIGTIWDAHPSGKIQIFRYNKHRLKADTIAPAKSLWWHSFKWQNWCRMEWWRVCGELGHQTVIES